MEEPVFLDLFQVVEIHRDQLERYGGSPGLRDLDRLQSAVAMPQAGFGGEYAHGDLAEMAAAYLFHLVQNHPFVDGNKRTGTAAALVFLELNGRSIRCSEDELVDLVLEVAQGKLLKAAIAQFFREKAGV